MHHSCHAMLLLLAMHFCLWCQPHGSWLYMSMTLPPSLTLTETSLDNAMPASCTDSLPHGSVKAIFVGTCSCVVTETAR